MKSVLISIQPKWCELIANGKKTVEVRKTRPKIDIPFKCYIYCTLSGSNEFFKEDCNGDIAEWNKSKMALKKGKVIGEFVCDRIQKYECEFVNDDCYEEIASISVDEDGDETGFIEWSNDSGVPYEKTDPYQESCVEYNELKKYIGWGFGVFYGWHISDLVIYDKPKELSEFKAFCKTYFDGDHCEDCEYFIDGRGYEYDESDCGCDGLKPLKRPPQSWCYVEEVE